MAQYLPLTLMGGTLGQRQHYLNLRVLQAVTDTDNFQDIEALPEQTPVDRLFKIDLANKLKNVDYILKTLKDDDMLYVSRALKCKWLVEQRDIINPKYLEDVLFPEMVMPAISKLKHWLYINLRNPLMCQEFYMYYKSTKFEFAVKFLSHCDEEFVFSEFLEILIKLSPHYLKVLCEKYPKLVKIYFDAMTTNKELVKRYLEDEEIFFKNIKCVLKSQPDIFFDITEKYYTLHTSNRLGPSVTDYIMRFHKSRFMAKPELYVVYLLHMPTVAKRLTAEECQEVVLKLARADFLSWWFSYATVEPLVKRISHDKRAAFKKLVFVKKEVGERVAEWPYTQPASPAVEEQNFRSRHIFDDLVYESILLKEMGRAKFGRAKKKKKKINDANFCMEKSELQKLFDEFRVVGFKGTLHELKTRIGAAQSADRRRDMLLVLVSKSGGRADAVRAVLQLAMRLRNEPNAWRLPQDVWDTMLEYGRGLGLDGSKPEAECREGLHAIVLRQLLAIGDCEPEVRTAFLEVFSTLAEYKLVASERVAVAAGLQRILTTVAAEAEPRVAASRLGQLLEVLEKYRVPFESSRAVVAVAALAERDWEAASPLLVRLYEARVGRRELLRQYLKFRHDDAACLNALRHEPDAITPEWIVKLLTDGTTQANQFLLKLAVYFSENEGPADKIREMIREKITKEPDVKLARPLATLAGTDISSIWSEQDVAGDKHHKLAAALRANMHHARPAPDALTLGWREAGMKAVAYRAMRSRPAQVKQLAQSLLEKREKRTVRLALTLAQRTDCAADLFSTAVTIRPLATLRAALLYYRNFGEAGDSRIWDIVKPLIPSVDLFPRAGLRDILSNVDWLPKAVKPDYCAILYLVLSKITNHNANSVLEKLMKCLPEISDDMIDRVMLRVLEAMDDENAESYPAIIIRYLMLSKSSDEQKVRFDKVGEPFLAKVYAFRDENNESRKYFFTRNYKQLLASLLYNAAFFDVKYQYCLPVIERVKTWMEDFLSKEMYFEQYVKIYATILYYKAVRQSMKQKPEVFDDPAKKLSEGVDIVGYTLGRYVAKELAELKKQYFESIIELYYKALQTFLEQHIGYGRRKSNFVAAIIKGIISESVGSETRLAVPILECLYRTRQYTNMVEEIKEIITKCDNEELQFFANAEIFTAV